MSETIHFEGLDFTREPDGSVLVRAAAPAVVLTAEQFAAVVGRMSLRAVASARAESEAAKDALIVLQLLPEREIGGGTEQSATLGTARA